MSAYVELMKYADRVESLGLMAKDVAAEAEEGVLAAARATAGAGQAPDGTPWEKRKDGGKALEGAADAITSKVQGSRIKLQIGPPYVFHQWGAGGSSTTKDAERARARTERRREKTGKASKFHAPRRQILPEPGDPLPEGMRTAVEEAAARVFKRAVG